jgi:hypothetical protein
MFAKRFFYVSAAILCLALAYHLGAVNVTAQTRSTGTLIGRYTVAAGSEQVILLDTATGEARALSKWVVPEKDFPKVGGGTVLYWNRISQDFTQAVEEVRGGEQATGKGK